MKEILIKICYDDEYCYKGYGKDTNELIKNGIKQYIEIDLEGDGVVKKGWTIEVVKENDY